LKVSAAEIGIRICDVEDGAISPGKVRGNWLLSVAWPRVSVGCTIVVDARTTEVVEAGKAKLKAQTRIMMNATIEWVIKTEPGFIPCRFRVDRITKTQR
jgi:hypothetical protein